jgi:hypothetical protein
MKSARGHTHTSVFRCVAGTLSACSFLDVGLCQSQLIPANPLPIPAAIPANPRGKPIFANSLPIHAAILANPLPILAAIPTNPHGNNPGQFPANPRQSLQQSRSIPAAIPANPSYANPHGNPCRSPQQSLSISANPLPIPTAIPADLMPIPTAIPTNSRQTLANHRSNPCQSPPGWQGLLRGLGGVVVL